MPKWWTGRCREIAESVNFMANDPAVNVTPKEVELTLLVAGELRKKVRKQEQAAQRHTCHAKNCTRQTPERMFMCAKHWRMVPAALKREVWSVYVEGQEIRKDPTREYLEVTRRAIEVVAEKEAA